VVWCGKVSPAVIGAPHRVIFSVTFSPPWCTKVNSRLMRNARRELRLCQCGGNIGRTAVFQHSGLNRYLHSRDAAL
jgi:hypothetical protein